jgi:hypothetical protein
MFRLFTTGNRAMRSIDSRPKCGGGSPVMRCGNSIALAAQHGCWAVSSKLVIISIFALYIFLHFHQENV